jgi:hypothetical protein
VATGGRLDVAKGLDFYVKTLPRIKVTDSLDTNWDSGALVTYTLRAIDTTGDTNPDFSFTAVDSPSVSVLEPEGDFSWNTAGKSLGSYVLRAKAQYGAHVLRKRLVFSVDAVVPASLMDPNRDSKLWIGGRAFAIPASAQGGRRALRVEYYGADGKTLRTVVGELTLPPDAPGTSGGEYRLSGFAAPGVRAWLDGVALRPVRD